MRVYKFLPCEYGLQAIQNRRLKILTVESLNDPFELRPFDLSHFESRWGGEQTVNSFFAKKLGMLCFCRAWMNPVIWSHYADSRKGMCLGFDLAADLAREGVWITYVKEPVAFTRPPTKETVEAMMFTKFDDWRYESEYRLWTSIEDKDGEFYFMNLDHRLTLATVILGVGCPLSTANIDRRIGPYAHHVEIQKARRSQRKFQMEIDDGTARRSDPREEQEAVLMSELLNSSTMRQPDIGRNDPCWCGSGKKLKSATGYTMLCAGDLLRNRDAT